ncbi:Os02g0807851 [Oryza sativa Japonica Group]|uniref:Os02g0807851 protein n=1 Tax=Oryza sativa subsp. japonica TaxID=39947 RepID=A0A0P0VR41_ORYSJ|nr:Os02g0807851 [Oryza sativa Japonica Group]
MLYNGIPFERDDTDRYRLISGDSTGYQEPGTKASSSVAVSSAFEQVLYRHSPRWSSAAAASRPMPEIDILRHPCSTPELIAGGRVLRCLALRRARR